MSDEDNNNETPQSGEKPKKSEIAGDNVDFSEVTDEMMKQGTAEAAKDVEAIYDIPVQISAVLGRSTMQVSQLLKLGRGAVVELDRKVGEAIDIYVNNRLVARGEVVVNEDRLGVTMTEIVKSDRTRQ
ncbi:MAG: flagellar motor switch protein FliN [Micavibrio sp.]|jgi:flagellar motor switch protein FliN/FliY|nr:MAG: flagellar motor switch protein FliN [Micavibrio sp.]